MMNDRELLMAAAKAYGLPSKSRLDAQERTDGTWYLFTCPEGKAWRIWNPLTDDGDALRLAVRLRIEIDHNHAADQVLWVSVRAAGQRCCYGEEFENEEHRYAATRRAIVRAAASIGKDMP